MGRGDSPTRHMALVTCRMTLDRRRLLTRRVSSLMAGNDVRRNSSHHRLDALSVSSPSPYRRTEEGDGDEVSHTREVPRIVEPVVQQGALASMGQPELPVDEHLILRPRSVAGLPSAVEAYAGPDIQEWNLHTTNVAEAHHRVES